MPRKERKKLAILTSYIKGESYGLLGPQFAATIIRENTLYDCIVIAVSHHDDKTRLKKVLLDYFQLAQPIVGFSYLCGREDLFVFAGTLKQDGFITFLAGPQADVDFIGEPEWQVNPHRFKGVSDCFTFALHGPAEQIVDLLRALETSDWYQTPGLLYYNKQGNLVANPKKGWDEKYLHTISWDTMYHVQDNGLHALQIHSAQVLQQLGCPYAAKEKKRIIDFPAALCSRHRKNVIVPVKGCSFCDVAVDKGFFGIVSLDTVLDQITGLPGLDDGRKVPFELINENPLPGLPQLLKGIKTRGISISQINLTLRADWLLHGQTSLRQALQLAQEMNVYICLTALGFESFDDSILENLNKGFTTSTNLKAIDLLRRLKQEFYHHWRYARSDGAVHGFIHPTPWDTPETEENNKNIIMRYNLPLDILPESSIPLIIHHASPLGDWMRLIEEQISIHYPRKGSIIEWWFTEEWCHQGDK